MCTASRAYVVADLEGNVEPVRVGDEVTFRANRRRESAHGKVDRVTTEEEMRAHLQHVGIVLRGDDVCSRAGEAGVAELPLPPANELVVPRDAVVDAGDGAYVYVVDGDLFSPRRVVLGEPAAGGIAVREGLAAGELVVSGATFAVDAESRLRVTAAASLASAR